MDRPTAPPVCCRLRQQASTPGGAIAALKQKQCVQHAAPASCVMSCRAGGWALPKSVMRQRSRAARLEPLLAAPQRRISNQRRRAAARRHRQDATGTPSQPRLRRPPSPRTAQRATAQADANAARVHLKPRRTMQRGFAVLPDSSRRPCVADVGQAFGEPAARPSLKPGGRAQHCRRKKTVQRPRRPAAMAPTTAVTQKRSAACPAASWQRAARPGAAVQRTARHAEMATATSAR